MPQSEEAARLADTNLSGCDNHHYVNPILRHYERVCTAAATSAHEILHLAAETDDANMVRLALHTDRIACELHAIAQVLSTALMLAMPEGEVAA